MASVEDIPTDLMVVGAGGNCGCWNPFFGLIGDLGDVGRARLKAITQDPSGGIYCVTAEGSVGLWTGGSWQNIEQMRGWALNSLAWGTLYDDKPATWYGVAQDDNVVAWFAEASAWWNLDHVDNWWLKMLTFDRTGQAWCVGRDGNVGKWVGGAWSDQYKIGGWTLRTIAFDRRNVMWCVSTDGNVGELKDGRWEDYGLLDGWNIAWLYFF